MPAGAAKCLQLPVGSVPATVWPKSHGPSGAGLFVLTAFYLLNSTQLQQDFLLLCLALTSHFTFKTKQNVPGRIKHFPQSPVWLWYPIMSARQMSARCADTSHLCWTWGCGPMLPGVSQIPVLLLPINYIPQKTATSPSCLQQGQGWSLMITSTWNKSGSQRNSWMEMHSTVTSPALAVPSQSSTAVVFFQPAVHLRQEEHSRRQPSKTHCMARDAQERSLLTSMPFSHYSPSTALIQNKDEKKPNRGSWEPTSTLL